MTVDAAERGVIAPPDADGGVSRHETRRGPGIEVFPYFAVQGHLGLEMTGVAEVVVPFEFVAHDPTHWEHQ